MYLIIDFEATCWEQKPNDLDMEIIEIGMVLLDEAFNIIYSGGFFVKPILQPVLSDFCKKLTSIKQSDVDGADILPVVLEKVRSDVRTASGKELEDIIFCSWGYYDKKQLIQDCKLHEIPMPFKYHVSLKHEFANKKGTRKPFGVIQAMNKIGMSFVGTHHRGTDDAYNIARIFIKEWGSTGLKLENRHLIDRPKP